MVCQRAARFLFNPRPLSAALVAIAFILPAVTPAQTQPPAEPGSSWPAASAATPQTIPAPAAPNLNAPASAGPAPSATPTEASSPASAPIPPPPNAVLTLPRDLSPWGMFMAADIVVKAVMLGLAF